jgi:mycothiol synthase
MSDTLRGKGQSVKSYVAYYLSLDVTNFDPERFQREGRRLSEQGIRVTTLAAERTLNKGALDRVYALHNECRRQQIPVETRRTPIPRERWDQAFVDDDLALPDGYFIAVDRGEYVGVSVIHRVTDQPDTLEAGFTGVRTVDLGRGIGLGLKIETILYARARGYREIRTGVLADNLAMLHINEKLGFRVRSQEYKQYVY